MVNKQEVVLMNFSKFEKSQEELIRGTAKLEQMNWSNIFETLLLPRLEDRLTYQELSYILLFWQS